MNKEKPREIAYRMIQNSGKGGEFVEIQLEKALRSLSFRDKALCRELVSGTLKWTRLLEWLILDLSKTPPKSRSLMDLLSLGLYQLVFLDRVPDHAAVHETVQLAKKNGLSHHSGYVNAILRRFIREKSAILTKWDQLKREQPALGYSHPDWLVKRWINDWGVDATLQLLEWNNLPSPIYLRVNTLKTDPKHFFDSWQREGISLEPFERDWIPENLVFAFKPDRPIQALPGFDQGQFYVQDPSTLMAVGMLDPKPGEHLLDLCAAPGGKTTYIAQLMNNQGLIHARDRDLLRLRLLDENCRRCGVDIVESARSHDAIDPDFNAVADRVLVDVPCSNTGVMRRRLESRCRLRPQGLKRLIQSQLDLLDSASLQVKHGGLLVYSTCSIDLAENSGLIGDWLASNTRFDLEGERQLTPFKDGVDGAYAAKLRRIG